MKSITTGSYQLDSIIDGVGGFPKGQITELSGESGSGKSSLVLSCIRNNINSVPLLVDTEYKFDAIYAREMGIDLGKILLLQSSETKAMETFAEVAIESGSQLVILDTLAGLMHEPRNLKLIMEHLTTLVSRDVCIILVNQIRFNPMTNSTVGYGGKPVAFYPALRINLKMQSHFSMGNSWEDEYVRGMKINATVTKNAFSTKIGIEKTLEIFYGLGVYNPMEVLDIAFSQGLITRNGSWYYYRDLLLGEGRLKASQKLATLPIYISLTAQIRSTTHESSTAANV